VWVCYHDNSKLRSSIIIDHLQLIKFWLSRAQGRGYATGRKVLAPARSVCVSL